MIDEPRGGTRRRASEIAQVAARHGFGYLFERGPFGRLAHRRHDEAARLSSRAQRLRDMLVELGPTWVKFGQLLSLRPDVVPPDIVLGLRELQDRVAPFPHEQAVAVIEETSSDTAPSPVMPVASVTVDATAPIGWLRATWAVSQPSTPAMSTVRPPNAYRSTGPTIDSAPPRASTARPRGASTGIADAPGTSSACAAPSSSTTVTSSASST